MKRLYKYLFWFIVFGFITSCVDEKITVDEPKLPQIGDTPYIVKLRLKIINSNFTTSTRADEASQIDGNSEFVNGSDYEYAIGESGNFAIFFDKDEKYISCADLYSVNQTETTPGMDATYTCRFYGFADREPALVLVVVNAPENIKKQIIDFPGWTLDEVRNQIWTCEGSLNFDSNGNLIYNTDGSVKYTNDPYGRLGFGEINVAASQMTKESGNSKDLRYFTMTNSTYVENGKVHCAETITGHFNIGTDDADADFLTAEELNPVTIYLERMVSKFSLEEIQFDYNHFIPTTAQALDVCKYNPDGSFIYEKYNWGIQILGWGINGFETENYLFKNVNPSGDWLSHSNEGWNDAYNKRCYWSIDPHYNKGDRGAIYPWQFDNARDHYDKDSRYYPNFRSYDSGDISALTYYPFTKFCPGFNANATGYFDTNYIYSLSSEPLYSPENTFIPGLTVDRSRGSRAYELAGTHVIFCARLLLPDENGTDYQPFTQGNLYKNRVGVSYIDEYSLFMDFMNAVNYKLTSQRYLYYKYYDWDSNDISIYKQDYRGQTIRARSEGDYALYCYFPYKSENQTINNLIKEVFGNNANLSDGVIIELTHDLIKLLYEDKDHYQLYKDADAINADGKVIPWIMYRDNTSSAFEPLKLMILERQPGDVSEYNFIENYNYGNSSNTGAEFILGNPDDKTNNAQVGPYLSGTQGNKVGLSTWGTSVAFKKFQVTDSQGGASFGDDFTNNNTLNTKWNQENTTTTGKGEWTVSGGQLQQKSTQMEGHILTFNQPFSRSYTIEVDATATSGREGFLIVFNYADEKNYCWWNVGGWGNSHHALEHVKNNDKKIYDYKEGRLQYNKSYHVMVKVNGANVKCYLDNTLIHDVTLPLGRELQYEAWDLSPEASDSYTGDANDVQSIFYENWGMADCFHYGLMYYAEPIYAQDTSTQNLHALDPEAKSRIESNANEDFKDLEKLQYYYGVIRNNWYKFTLHSINDIGIPVLDPTKPIVPNYDNKLNQNKVEMEILRWHMEDITVEIPK